MRRDNGFGTAGGSASRRQLLEAMAGLALTNPFMAMRANAAAQRPQRTRDIIDVHHHIIPPAFKTHYPDLPGWLKAWQPEQAVANMDRAGIATAITSLSAPGLGTTDPEIGRKVSRACNEYAASLAQLHPGRFGSFAAIAPRDVDGSLAEITYALDVLKADGIAMMSSYDGHYLASRMFQPILEELNRRKATLFVHPTLPETGTHADPPLSPILLEMPYDTARCILGMVLAGTFQRYSGIRFLFNHGAAALLVLQRRIDLTFEMDPSFKGRFPGGLTAALKDVYFDTVNALDPVSMAVLRHTVTTDKLLFGTDQPGFPPEVNLAGFDQLSQMEAQAIGRTNALALLPRLRENHPERRDENPVRSKS